MLQQLQNCIAKYWFLICCLTVVLGRPERQFAPSHLNFVIDLLIIMKTMMIIIFHAVSLILCFFSVYPLLRHNWFIFLETPADVMIVQNIFCLAKNHFLNFYDFD